MKKNDRIYRDIPLQKVSYIENQWHDRRIILLIIGAILLLFGIIMVILSFFVRYTTALTSFLIIGIIAMIPSIILLIKGLKQYGYLLINNEDWKFQLFRKEDINQIEHFIQYIYSLIS